MRMAPDCIPCVIGNIIHLADEALPSPADRESLTRELLEISAGISWEDTPPEYARCLYWVLDRFTGGADLFAAEKDQSTEIARQLLPLLREKLAVYSDPFPEIVRLVIGGNIIDYGVDRHFRLETVRDRLLEVFDLPIDLEAVAALRQALEAAGRILYILDNCGEAVIDRLLIERYAGKITLAVRGAPVFNDITRREVAASGLGEFPLITTGDSTPGVSLTHAAPEFLAVMRSADLVIAKGQGNFETLSDYDRPIFFLLRAKCGLVCRYLGGAPHHSLQVIGRQIGE